jgi:hypothetical protein
MKRNASKLFMFAVGVALGSCSIAVAADRSGLTAYGMLRFDASGWVRSLDRSDSAVCFAGMNMLTLNVTSQHLKTAKVEGALDIYQLYGVYSMLQSGAAGDHVTSLLSGRASLFADLRTLYAALYLPWADVTLGRQIVNYGKGMLFSPLDVFSSVNLVELSFRRSGSDIVMVSVPLGDLSGIDAVTELPTGKGDHTSSVRGFVTVAHWDLSVAALYRHRAREASGGVAFKGDLIAGITGELVTHYDRDMQKWRFEAMGGADYSIGRTVMFAAEYLYRNGGAQHPVYDRHNIFGTVQYRINDLMSLSLVLLGALPKENGLATLQYSWNLLQSVTTIFYLRYYHLDGFRDILPGGEGGVRVEVSF